MNLSTWPTDRLVNAIQICERWLATHGAERVSTQGLPMPELVRVSKENFRRDAAKDMRRNCNEELKKRNV
jgi:hypothetical protein